MVSASGLDGLYGVLPGFTKGPFGVKGLLGFPQSFSSTPVLEGPFVRVFIEVVYLDLYCLGAS